MKFAERENMASRWNFFSEEMKGLVPKKKKTVVTCRWRSGALNFGIKPGHKGQMSIVKRKQTNVSSVSPSSEERKKDSLWRRANYLAFPIFSFCPLQSPGFWNPGQFVRLIYSDRMRTVKDKQMVRSCFLRYSKHWFRCAFSVCVTRGLKECRNSRVGLNMIE